MANNFTKNVISAINIKDVKYNIKAIPFHATEAEWNGMSYIPKQGEFIVYDVDSNNTSPRFKTGDGVTDVKNLPFTLATISEVWAYVNSQIGSAGHLKRIVLEDGAELPDVSEADIDTIYMKKNSGSRLVSDVFDEYMVINGNWEIIGNTRVDLSDYTTQEMVDEKIETAISSIDFPEEIYKQNEAPTDAEEGALWLDTDEEAVVSGGGAGAVQADWNAVEGEPGYILNKPFGEGIVKWYPMINEEEGYGEVLENIEVSANDNGYTIVGTSHSGFFFIEKDITVKIGEEVFTASPSITMDPIYSQYSTSYLGDQTLTSMPFWIEYNGLDWQIKVTVKEDLLPTTISIYREENGVTPLDSKYIGNDIARSVDMFSGSWYDLSFKPFGESTIVQLVNCSVYDWEYIDSNNSYRYNLPADVTSNIDSLKIGVNYSVSIITMYDRFLSGEISLSSGSDLDNGGIESLLWEYATSSYVNFKLYRDGGVYYIEISADSDEYNSLIDDITSVSGYFIINENTETTIEPRYLPKATAVADAVGETVTAAEFNTLLTALRNAGYLSE